MRYKRKHNLFLFAVFITVFIYDQAFAYLDPGTGSLIFQIILAALLAAGLTAKLWWRKMISFFARLFPRSKNQNKDGKS